MKGAIVLAKLVAMQNARHWVRAIVSLLGVAVSVCLVVWVIWGYEALLSKSAEQNVRKPGQYDIVVSPQGFNAATLDPKFVEQIKNDPAVEKAVPGMEAAVRIISPLPAGGPGGGPPGPRPGPGPGMMGGGTKIAGTDAAEAPCDLEKGRWVDATNPAVMEAVIAAQLAQRLKIEINGEMTVRGAAGDFILKVVGIFDRNATKSATGQSADIFTSTDTKNKIAGNADSDRPSTLNIILKKDADVNAFVAKWRDKARAAAPAAQVQSMAQGDQMGMFDARSASPMQVQAYYAIGASFLAACFIIFVTMSSGVRDRIRQYAILRAVAISRGQLAFLIFFESILFGIVGWGAGLALARIFLGAGRNLGDLLPMFRTTLFAGDSPMGSTAVLVAGLCAITGAVSAAILPCWQAVRLKPVDILGGRREAGPVRIPWIAGLIGLALILVNPAIVLFTDTHVTAGKAPYYLAGCVAMVVGFALMTPLVIRGTEYVFGPALAWVLRLDRRFLRQQLSGNMWRTIGTVVAMSIGLNLFVTILVWGYSMLVPFTPSESLPRLLVAINPAGLPESEIANIKLVKGVKGDECLPLAVEQAKLSDEFLNSTSFGKAMPEMQYLLFMGVDPAKAFGGDKPVIGVTFVQGDRETALKQMSEGRYCLVPDHFSVDTKLGVGDKVTVVPPGSSDKEVTYTIAGVIYVPGWHWFTKFSEIRKRSGRAGALVFVSYNAAKEDFHLSNVNYFWTNTDGSATRADFEKRFQAVADASTAKTFRDPVAGEMRVGKQHVTLTDREELKAMLMNRANDVIWAMTYFPLITLVITSLAVFNTVAASIRARFWQIGILRGIGMTKGQLFRLILCESTMICAAVCVLSLSTGIITGWCALKLRLVDMFAMFTSGMTPPLVIPWSSVGVGFLMAFVMCFLAGIIPAIIVTRKEPLKFIQAGRLAW